MESPYTTTTTTTTTTKPNAHQTLSRRNSIATSIIVPSKLTLPPNPRHASAIFPTSTVYGGGGGGGSTSSSTTSSLQSFPPFDFELLSIKPLSYTSLKDLLPPSSYPAVQSPTTSSSAPGGGSGYEISIRNRLVKQAAWAYLQPMSTSPDSSSSSSSAGRQFLHRLWARISGLLGFFSRSLTRAFDWVLRAVRIWSSRYQQ